MKKFGSILLTLAVLLTLCAGALPVYAEDASITLTPYRTILVVGQSASLSITTTSTVTDVTVVSSDTSVLTYNSTYKTLTGVGKGTAIITATGTDSDTNETVTASVTIVVCDSTGLLTSTDYYIMNYSTGKLLSLSAQSDANSVNIDSRARSASPLSQWTAIKNSDGTIRLQSVYSSTGRSAYVSGTNLILYNSTGARTELTIFRVETGRFQGLYQIQYNGQYLYMNSSGDVYFSSVLGNGAYWSFMEADKNYADFYTNKYTEDDGDLFDTTTNNSDFESTFSKLGYLAYAEVNSSAAYAYSWLQEDDVFIFNGHGNSGIIAFRNDDGVVSTIDVYDIHDLDNNSLAGLRCVLYVGCSTGTDYVTYNLVRMTYEKGAHFVLGTTEVVYTIQTNPWLDSFIYYIGEGYSINNAIISANQDLNNVSVPIDPDDLTQGYRTVYGLPYTSSGDGIQHLD